MFIFPMTFESTVYLSQVGYVRSSLSILFAFKAVKLTFFLIVKTENMFADCEWMAWGALASSKPDPLPTHNRVVRCRYNSLPSPFSVRYKKNEYVSLLCIQYYCLTPRKVRLGREYGKGDNFSLERHPFLFPFFFIGTNLKRPAVWMISQKVIQFGMRH